MVDIVGAGYNYNPYSVGAYPYNNLYGRGYQNQHQHHRHHRRSDLRAVGPRSERGTARLDAVRTDLRLGRGL